MTTTTAQLTLEKPREFKASFWKKEKEAIRCNACHRHCLIAEGRTGFCRVRKNIEGQLIALNYGRTMGLPIDPIEKKPLFHFRPGTQCAGVSTYGCNFRCLFCQNYMYSMEWTQALLEKVPFTPPAEIVDFTLRNNLQGIAYTYTEPTVFVEYALETMKKAKEYNLYNVWVSNGYMSQAVLEALKPYLDGINIDLKGDKKFYQEVCGNVDLEKVKQSIAWCYKNKIHLEVTNLIVPGKNDKEENFREVSQFIHSLDSEIPLHFTRFFPAYKMSDVPPTEISSLKKAKSVAEKIGLKYVYVGNVSEEENTYCPKCRSLLIRRLHFFSENIGLKENTCQKCGAKINLIP